MFTIREDQGRTKCFATHTVSQRGKYVQILTSVYDLTDAALKGDSIADEECLLIRRQRRQRAKYTSRQRHELEEEFEKNPYPNAWERETLAHKLGIHETRIQVMQGRPQNKLRFEIDKQNAKQRLLENTNGVYILIYYCFIDHVSLTKQFVNSSKQFVFQQFLTWLSTLYLTSTTGVIVL